MVFKNRLKVVKVYVFLTLVPVLVKQFVFWVLGWAYNMRIRSQNN